MNDTIKKEMYARYKECAEGALEILRKSLPNNGGAELQAGDIYMYMSQLLAAACIIEDQMIRAGDPFDDNAVDAALSAARFIAGGIKGPNIFEEGALH